MHDKMYANYRKLTRENMLAWAGEIGLDVKRFTAELGFGQVQGASAEGIRRGA